MDKVVILAAGMGTRMQKQDQATDLTEAQARAAESGAKAMIPIERPFLDYILTVLADAGYKRICLVIGQGHGSVRDYYSHQAPPKRLTIDFAVQAKPLGTANAVAAAEAFVADDSFLMINSDNHYPLDAVRALREINGPGLAGFERQALIDKSNIPADRVCKFAAADISDSGRLRQVIEKPTEQQLASLGTNVYVSMNCWRFTPNVFNACREIEPSQRNEYEITDAAQYCIDHLGEQFQVVKSTSPVLDMSSRQDVAPVTKLLAGTEVSF
jgi:dTDP-glucose pyrophosphorylase